MEPDPHILLSEVNSSSKWGEKYMKLTEAIGRLIEDFSLVRFYPLNIKNEENIGDIFLTINSIIQFGEDEDVKGKDIDLFDEECEQEDSFG